MQKCVLHRKCKNFNTDKCNNYCYPYVFMHSTDGQGGFWATRNVPKKYSNCFIENLDIQKDNLKLYKQLVLYVEKILEKVQEGGNRGGIYFVGATGTGKTATAITILNEYLIARVIQHLKREKKIVVNPVMFLKLAEFQNTFNSQFRGSPDKRNENSDKYFRTKKIMKEVDLLVLDDIALCICFRRFRDWRNKGMGLLKKSS